MKHRSSIAVSVAFAELAWIFAIGLAFGMLWVTETVNPIPEVAKTRSNATSLDQLLTELAALRLSNEFLKIRIEDVVNANHIPKPEVNPTPDPPPNDLDQLLNEIASIRASNMLLKTQIEVLSDLHKLAKTEVDDLRQKNQEMTNAFTGLSNTIAGITMTNRVLASMLQTAKSKIANLESVNHELSASNLALQSSLLALREEKRQALELQEELRKEVARLSQFSAPKGEGQLRMEILGLKGRLKNVLVVFDTSASMGKSRRWDSAVKIVETWLSLLPIEKCALITFGDHPNPFPKTKGWLSFSGPTGGSRRQELLNHLKSVSPSGRTMTFEALQLAYEYKGLDTIILFTDGRPNGSVPLVSVNKKILDLAQRHPNITVNTVGLGEYFHPKVAEFLIELAEKTGGSFLGR